MISTKSLMICLRTMPTLCKFRRVMKNSLF
nr:MAG TPA: hypothetical protein [Caudoviricetes sp.]